MPTHEKTENATSLLEANADLALIDRPGIRALLCMSDSWIDSQMKEGCFPLPIVRRPRFTRWRLGDVRKFLAEQIGKNTEEDKAAEARVMGAARTASVAAKAAREVRKAKGTK